MEIIKTNKLTKSYGRSRGIIDLDLMVKQGEFFGFIGPNGAGKSTTIKTLLGLIVPTSGQAMVFGKDVTRQKESILEDIGYLPSESQFYHGMKVKEVLKLSSNLRKKDCSKEADILCERLKLDTSRKVDELSFGNRKKVSIVCALQHNPQLLILDEPTSGLDPLMQKKFFDILRERNDDGVTVFLSSHVLSEVQRNCTRAAIIRDGRLVACDSVEALSNTSAKRVNLHGTIDFACLSGVKDKIEYVGAVSFLYSGDMASLVKVLSSGHIEDLTITEPDLEEVFMHYYEKGGEEI